MDIQRFIQQRKRLGISQTELCTGICTQSTLSKFENRGRVPSVKILSQLCKRLGITIGDLSGQPAARPRRVHPLDQVEQLLIAERFPAAIQKLATVDVASLPNFKRQMQYYYLKGMIDTLTSNQTATTTFDFTQILDKLDEQHETIFSQLAYLGFGILYARKNRLGDAEFFFTKVIKYLNQRVSNPKKLRTLTTVQYNRLVMMLYYVAEYQALRDRLDSSNRFLQRVTTLCAGRYETYLMPRAKLLAANNALQAGAPSSQVNDLLAETLAFARFNGNSVVELQAAALKKQLASLS
ncbi:helix-turn-helix domain-containing protein [Limosilactobacillus sp.]|uniref:helix-turn-helix domain-containing protein n=1 Tax=Limosilactobacillus sp. TaxID=2773925 RepID=UPI003F06166C